MASRLPKRTIAVADVEKTTSFMALMGMAQELQIEVPMAKQNVTGIKTVLMDHLTQRGGSQLVKEPKRWDTTSAASSDDLSNRLKLREFYSNTLRYVETLPAPFEMDLNQVFPNYKQRIMSSVEELKVSRCVLLVAGETGAGKTSLVNLLLGMSILPTSDLSCTAAIVEIQYGPEPCAELHYIDDSSGRSKHPVKLKCHDNSDTSNFIKELEHHITLRNPETEETPYEKIQIFWPLGMLKGGATIVDSPGVGDSRALPQQLTDYMERAFGFIYVIDSTTAIHKHRLGQLLVKATEGNDNTFDPDTAMFVCNRWDQIHQDDADRVLNAINDRLTMILPGVKKSQLFPISIKESRVSVEYGQVTREHQHLIEGIRNFLPHTMSAKLRIYYRYLSSVLKRSLYSLRLSYLATKSTMSKMQEQAIKRDKRKQMLQKNTQEKLDLMRREVKTATIGASESLFHYLNSMHARTRLCTWSDRELPRKEKWQNVLKNASMMISERLAFEINEWEHNSHVVDQVAKNIVGKFQKQFELYTDEVAKVEGAFLNAEDRIMLDFNQAMQRNANPKKMAKAAPKGKDAGFLSLGASIVSNLNLDQKDSNARRIFRDLFEKDPWTAMKEATEILVSQLTEENAMISIGKYFDRFVKGIDRVGKLVPHLLKADQTLLEDISKQLIDTEEKLKAFPNLSKNCSNLQGSLDMLYLQRLMVMDYTADKLEYTEKDRLGQGSFATVYKAKLGAKIVALKEPKQSITKVDVTDILLEEAMLRETTHKNIVGYFGSYRKGADDRIRLNMVMEFCPFTIKDKYLSNNNSPSQYGSNPIRQIQAIGAMTYFLIQICDGLSYLHDKNIVHRDLKPENLLVTEDNVVKIADLGLAKKVKDIVTTAIGTPVYMAPEVLLLSEKYDTKADIYSFGMIAWELWYGQDLAHYASMELQGGLKVNIEKRWRPSLTIEAAPTEFWKKLITMSWHQEPQHRPTAKDIGRKLVDVYKQVEEAKKRQREGK